MGYTFKKHFLRVNYTPTCLKIKTRLWPNGFKSPALACVSHKFFPEPLWECKQLRDAGDRLEYIIRLQQTADDYLLEHLGEKRKAQWTTFNFNVLKGIVLEISSNKNAD